MVSLPEIGILRRDVGLYMQTAAIYWEFLCSLVNPNKNLHRTVPFLALGSG